VAGSERKTEKAGRTASGLLGNTRSLDNSARWMPRIVVNIYAASSQPCIMTREAGGRMLGKLTCDRGTFDERTGATVVRRIGTDWTGVTVPVAARRCLK